MLVQRVTCAIVVSMGLYGVSCHSYVDPSSVIRVDSPDAAKQLLAGFYSVENSWRWVARKFVVALKPPPNSEMAGATLSAQIYLPASEIAQLHSLTLTAAVNGKPIGHETYTSSGTFEFRRAISPALLRTNILPVEFCFDKAMAPGNSDNRELAAVVTEIGLLTGPHP